MQEKYARNQKFFALTSSVRSRTLRAAGSNPAEHRRTTGAPSLVRNEAAATKPKIQTVRVRVATGQSL
jgi:hypothetical protein